MIVSPRRVRARVPASIVVLVSVLLLAGGPPAAAGSGTSIADDERRLADEDPAARGWVWPIAPFHLDRPFVAPAHPYGPGHRGIDLRPVEPGVAVRAPADGVIAFSGQVAGRGVLTIDHGDGLVSTLEPVVSDLAAGTRVTGGAPLGDIAEGGHSASGTLHFGVRLHGEYINPMVLLGGVPRAVLLPCC